MSFNGGVDKSDRIGDPTNDYCNSNTDYKSNCHDCRVANYPSAKGFAAQNPAIRNTGKEQCNEKKFGVETVTRECDDCDDIGDCAH